MTLEDFFTLTEMNNGLTVPSRVEEFMAIMQKERDCIVKNAGVATRQWSAVAKAISATENKECLNLFIKLDGLLFIAKWLKDSQKFSNELSDTLLEESICHLLQALEKLNLDFEKVVDAEIWTTVEDLIVHNSTKVQDKARMLFESWKGKRDGEKIVAVTDYKIGKNVDTEGDKEFSLKNASLSKEISDEEKGKESTGDDPVLTLSSDNVQSDQVETGHNSAKNDESLGPASSPSLSVMEPTSVQSCSSVVSRQDTVDGHTEFNQLESSSDIKQAPKIDSSQEQSGLLGENNSSEDKFLTSGSDSADAMKSATELNAQRFTFTEDKFFGRKVDSDEKGAMDDSGSANQCRSSSAFTADKRGESNHHMLHKSSNDEKSWENAKTLGPFLSGTENDGNTNNLGQHVSGGELKNDHNFAKQEMEKKSDNELEYGILDPLEVARQVAIEVERDNREQSSNSSEKLPEGNVRKPDRTETQSHASECPPNDVEDELNSSPLQEESVTSSENLETKEINDAQEMETSQITETTQEEEADTERGLCNFDLNQNICSEDNDHPANQNPTPVSIVSASRAAAAARLPVAPLQFEGNLGWKGSAATSAFRPASPRRVLESDKDLSIGRSNLNFDLNVAENVGLPESSSVETHSRKSERLELDLNLTSEDGGPPTDWQMAQLFPQGNDHSSSSSTKQPSLRNFNLNDQPSFLNDPSENSFLSKLTQSFNGDIKSDDSVISIMGRRVEVNRKDTIPTFPFPNGQTPELGFDVNLGRPANFLGIGPVIPYTHSSAYGYNNIAVGPTMPFSSTMYGPSGPIPYMVDSRGAPVIPQFVGGPASALPTVFSQQPFFVNMTSSNEVGPVGPIGPPRGSFDVNTGMMVGNGSRDPSGFSQFLNSGQLRSMDGSVVGGKRKEPENGFENYPFKHYTPPPWK